MKNIIAVIAVAVALVILPQAKSEAQGFNFACVPAAIQAAASHQCSPDASRFGCRLQKLSVGFGAYLECNGGTLSRVRARRQSRRFARQRTLSNYSARTNGYSYPANYCY